MNIVEVITISELSRLTKKSRPTLYKYINDYENQVYDNIPFNFIKLFELILNEKTTKKEIIKFCDNKFNVLDDDYESQDVNEVIEIIKTNKDKINFVKLKKILKGLIK